MGGRGRDQSLNSPAMKLLKSVLTFASTLLLAMFWYACTAIQFPVTMRDLLLAASQIRDQAAGLFAKDSAGWINIMLWPHQTVFLCFALAAHAVIDIAGRLLSRVRLRKPASEVSRVVRRRHPSSRWG